MGIDYGGKRTGIAVTDPLQIIASPLDTVPTEGVLQYLETYFFTEEVERIIVGEPRKHDDTEAEIMPKIRQFIADLNKKFPHIPIDMQDEQYTSHQAKRIILQAGIPKMKRRDKSLVDKVSASIILREWMEANGKWERYV
ncbi:MAG: Holliday junction resolvase RuvX [Saprospiraceae bacterium]|nr:Holliday junction resolvase RuvX [Saprospiraceae bacterium]